MKNNVVIILWIFSQLVSAQQLAQNYLSNLPKFPDNGCAVTETNKNTFYQQIDRVIEAIELDIERIHKQQPPADQNQLLSTVSGGEAADEQLAQQKLMKDHGISSMDLKKIENMSEEELQEWGEKYVASNRGKHSQSSARKQYNIKLQDLQDRLSTYKEGWVNMQAEYEKKEKQAKTDLDLCLEMVLKNTPEPQYRGEACINQDVIDEYITKNEQRCNDNYCQAIAPLKKQMMNKKMGEMPQVLRLLSQIQTIQNDQVKEQTGLNLNASQSNELAALELVKEFAGEMRSML